MTPARRADVLRALRAVSQGEIIFDLDLRGNGVASLVTELLDDAQRYETAYEHARQRLSVHEQRIEALRQHLPDLGSQLDSQGPWEAALVNVARQLAAVPEMSDEIAKLRTEVSRQADIAKARYDINVAAQEAVAALQAQVAALTPRWQEGEPPDGPVWREGVAHPVRVKRSERYGLMYWDDGFRSWAADYGEPQPRWAPIPKPTEG